MHKVSLKLKSTDLTAVRDINLADVKRAIRVLGQNREKEREAASIAHSEGSSNVMNVFDEAGEFICAIGWKPSEHKKTNGLFICG